MKAITTSRISSAETLAALHPKNDTIRVGWDTETIALDQYPFQY